MTSIPVGNVVKGAHAATKTGYGTNAGAKAERQNESFQDAMNLFGKSNMPNGGGVEGTMKTDSKSAKDAYDKAGNKGCKFADKVQDAAKLSKEDLSKVQMTEKEVIKKIADELGVSEEEVAEAMENLGFTLFDLSNANNMAMLMTDLLHLSDSMALVTDASLFESMTTLTQMADEMLSMLSDELGIPAAAIEEQFELLVNQTDLAEENDGSDEFAADNVENVQAEQNAEEGQMQVISPENKNAEQTAVQDVKANAEVKKDHVQEQTTDGREVLKQEGMAEASKIDAANDKDAGRRQAMNQNTFQTFSNTAEQIFANQNEQPVFSMRTVDSILNQIGEYVNIHAAEDVTKMDIALTPESLGTVHIHMASKSGAVTAQIITENEMVKQAIETQVVQLKEKLESQGVKIEAVEVTVASHEFERNLDDNSENRESQEKVKKASRKKWNLSDMEEGFDEEELGEAEKVELDMMKLSGNQLNYTV